MHIADFSVKNPVMVNLIMVALIVIGLVVGSRMPLEIFPSVQLELVSITTEYQGASAEDVEQLISIPIEEEINGLNGVKVVRSVSSEGLSSVRAELEPGEDIRKLAEDIRAEIAKIQGQLPVDAEEPVVQEIEATFPLINVAIAGDIPRETLRAYAIDLRDKLRLVPGVGTIYTSGMGDPVFWVLIQPAKLRQYNISLEQVAEAIQNKNLDLPGGAFEQNQVEFLVRTRGRVHQVEDLMQIPVRTDPDGRHVFLQDIATIKLGEEKAASATRINGLPGITFWVNKQKNIDAIKTVQRINRKIEEFQQGIPSGIQVVTSNDTSYWVRERFKTMVKSGITGLVIVVLLMLAFLDWRATLMAALGLPVAFLGAFLLMHMSGITLNILSMFGLILVLGILVDDAVIVGENIQRYVQQGMSPRAAAIRGTKEVALPVVATILTNIAAFTPLLLATGLIGKFLSVIPQVAIFAFAMSLVEALLILPSHCADYLKQQPGRRVARRWVFRFRSYYLKALFFVMRHRYITVGSFAFVLLITMVVLTQMPFSLFYSRDIAQFNIRMENPNWSDISATQESVAKLEKLIRENIPEHVLKNTVSMIGLEISRREPEYGDHLSTIIVEYEDFDKRKENGLTFMNLIRQKAEDVLGPARVEFIRTEGPPAGKPVEVRIQGKDFDTLKDLASRTQKYLSGQRGVFGISDDLVWGKPEIRIEVDEKKAALYGLDTSRVARIVRGAVDGLTVARTRVGKEETHIIVRYDLPPGDVQTLLQTSQIPAPNGGWVPLSALVDMKIAPSMLRIARYDSERAVRVVAELDQKVTTAREVNAGIELFLNQVIPGYPGYSFSFGGEEEETRESITSIFQAMLITIVLIYAILASMLKSYTQPLIIMSVLPFAIIGVAIGILLRGEPFSLPALIGTVALLGIVVNDSLVLMDFVNKRRKLYGTVRAVALSAKHRFRAVILTTVTTFGGLFSLMIQTRGESAFLAPMAIALGFGLLFATMITLFLIPSLYLILSDIHAWLRQRLRREPVPKPVQIPDDDTVPGVVIHPRTWK